jgi:O-antigen/teichoic acid export membrane protein
LAKTSTSFLSRVLPFGLSYAGSSAALVVASASQLVMFAVLARFMGVAQFSLFVSIVAFTAVGVQLCGLGGMDSLARRVARVRSSYPVMLGHNLILTVSTGALLVIAGTAIIPFFFPLSPVPLINFGACALLLLANIPLLRMIMLSEQICIAHSQFAAANRVVVVSSIVRAGAAIVACMVFGVTDVATWAPWHFAANGSMALLCWYWQRNLGAPEFRIVREEVPLGIYFSTQFIFKAIRQNADLMALSLIGAPELVASYAVARRVLDSSYIAVDALYRLMYPGSAAVTMDGIHLGMARARRLLLLTVSLSLFTSFVLFLGAPYLPLLFGAKYVSMPGLIQVMCWAGVIVAFYAAALEMLGAAGHQGAKAAIINGANIMGALLVVVVTWYAGIHGTIAVGYIVETSVAVAAWLVMYRLAERSHARATQRLGVSAG